MAKYYAIESYKNGSTEFNSLRFEVAHRKWMGGMVLSVTPVHKDDLGYSQVIDFSKNPLTAGIDVAIVPMQRKSQKRIDAAMADLCGLAPVIVQKWNEREILTGLRLYSRNPTWC